MPLKTKRWDDEVEPDDGFRLLVCRYRPRYLKKEFETWEAWMPELGPSVALHAGAYGKGGLKIGWDIYRRRYLLEMRAQKELIADLARRVKNGEPITLLCSSSCVKESRCHRSILAELIEEAVKTIGGGESRP
jgi:uncharacterized protein YeaO (DUF488 family)